MAVYILTINSIERPLRVGSLDFRKVINGPDVFSCTVLSELGAYRPALSDDVKLSEDGVDVFGGFITKTDETGADDQPLQDIATEINCVGYADLFEYAHITETFAIGTTIASIAGTLVTNYLSLYGVTLDAGQLTGPSLTEEIATDGVLLTDFFDTLLTNTGYAPRINADQEFILYLVGGAPAAFNVVQGTDDQIGDVRVVRSRTKRYNRIIVKYGENIVVTHVDSFVGDGVADTFQLTFPIQGPFPPTATLDNAIGYGVVNYASSTESLGEISAPVGYFWEYDATTLEVTRRSGAVANAVPFDVRYDVQFPQVTMVEDAADVAANGPFEVVILLPTIYDKALAEAQATALLARYLSEPEEVTYQTLTLGLEIGTVQTITASDRNISGEFLVSEIHTQILGASQDLIRTVKAVGGSTFQGTFRELYIRWLNPGGSSATTTIGPAVSTGGGGLPGAPPFSAQYNDNGVFGGADGTEGAIYMRPDGGGPGQGVPNTSALLALEVVDDAVALAIANMTAGRSKAITFRVEDDGSGLIEHSDPQGFDIIEYGGQLGLLGVNALVDPTSVQFGDYSGRLAHYWKRDAMAVRRIRVTGTTYTIDSEASGGGGVYGAWIFDPTAACTVTLPSVSAFMGLPSSGYGRVLELRNDSALYVVTLDGSSSELIFRGSTGRLTLPLMPGASVKLIALDSTGAGWKVLAYDIPPTEVALTNAQLKAFPTTPIQMVASPGAGCRIKVISASFVIDTTAGAYTNINATYAHFVIQYTTSTYFIALALQNDNSYTVPLARVSQFFGSAHAKILDWQIPYVLSIASASPQGTPEYADYIQNAAMAGPADAANNAVSLQFDNNGSGDLTGGHASNTAYARLYYDLEWLP